MNISVNGQSKVPPGFRFHPTEEELLHYYLKKKISLEKIDLDVIHEVDLNKLEPWDIQERCKIGTTTQTDWYLFSHKDKKYPSGSRTNRATAAGFWKATGRDKVIYSTSSRRIIGMRKTLVFYTGRAPHGHKSDWIMYEYRLDDPVEYHYHVTPHTHVLGEPQVEEGWVVCRIFKKRNHHQQKSQDINTSTNNIVGDLLCDEDNNMRPCHVPSTDMFVKSYEYDNGHVISSSAQNSHQQACSCNMIHAGMLEEQGSNMTKWSAVDQLVACQLDGQTGDHDHSCFDHDLTYFTTLADHHLHQELQLQALTNQSSYSQICSLWG